MTVSAGDRELDLIDAVIGKVTERLGHEPPVACQEFVRQLFHWVPAQDLNERAPDDLAGMALSQFELAGQRAQGEPKVSVYNPDDPTATDGAPAHTAVEIVCDDMPFLVDSITMELNRQDAAIELLVHPVMRVVRHDEELVEVLVPDQTAYGFQVESVIHVDVARQTDPDRLAVLRAGIEVVLEEVRAAVEDWGQMRAQTTALATELRRQAPPCELHLLEECEAFLDWLSDDNFTYLGYREYELLESGALDPIPGTGLGILRGTSSREPNVLSGRALDEARSSDPLVLTKANSKARVHRPSYLDYVGVKRFAADGRVIGERRFLGLYTGAAYRASPRTIPRLRDKVEYVLTLGGFPPDSHDAKGLIDILESLPRDLLVEISQDDLFDLAIGILGLGERPRVRLFVSPDRLDRFVACTLCLPRDRFNTDNRVRAEEILARAFGGTQVDWRLHLSESVIVRVDYIVRCPDGIRQREPVSVIESRITEVTRSWGDELRVALNSRFGERDGVELYRPLRRCVPRRLPGRVRGADGDRRHRSDRPAAQHRQTRDRRLPPRRRGGRGGPLPGVVRGARVAVGCRAEVRAHGRDRRRRAAVRDRARRVGAGLGLRLRPALRSGGAAARRDRVLARRSSASGSASLRTIA